MNGKCYQNIWQEISEITNEETENIQNLSMALFIYLLTF